MTLIYDRRWDGPHGIGRFSRELRRRLAGDIVDLRGAHPVSLRGLAEIEVKPHLLARGRRAVFFTPGYCPPRTWRGRSVVTVHDLIHLREPGERRRATSLYYDRVVRPALRSHRTLVLTVSDFSRDDIVAWAGIEPERVVVVGNGVDRAFRPDGPVVRRPRPYVLHVGNTKPHKNLPRLLAALARVDGLDLVLSAAPDANLLARAARLGIADRVSFLGGIADVNVRSRLRR